MKTLKFVVVGMMLILAGALQGQLSVRVHVGTPPAWGPAGYSNVRYYYLPDVEAYYDVQTSMFIYMSGNTWVRRSYLPDRYRNYDLYHGYKVVMNDYRGNSPYSNFREHRMKYSKGYHGNPQRNIGDRNYQNNNHQDQHMMDQPNRQDNRMMNQNQNRTVKHSNVRVITKKQVQRNDNNKRDGHDNGNQK
jgi:hypothetical protein